MSNPAEPSQSGRFDGYTPANYTMVPDQLFDEQLVDLSGAELKVLLYIMRHTFGWKKDSDNISLSQMLHGITRRDGTIVDHGTGVSKRTLLTALNDLEAGGYIVTTRRQSAERGYEPTNYRLNVKGALPVLSHSEEETAPPLVQKLHQGHDAKTAPSPRSKNFTIQDTTGQETTKQYSNDSKDTRPENDPRVPGGSADRDVPPAPRTSKTEVLEPHAAAEPRTVAEPQRPSNGQLTSVREILAGKPPPRPRSPRKRLPKTEYLDTVIRELSAELHDEEHVASNLAQARNLMARTGLSESALVARVYEARSITKQQGGIVKPAGNGLRNKMPYCFAVLRDLLGLDQERPAPSGLSDDDLDASLAICPIDPPTGGSG